MSYFIFGILLIYLFLPALENISSILNTATQYILYKISKKTYDIKLQMQQSIPEEKSSNYPIGFATQAIGFQYEQPEEEEQAYD